MPPRSQLPAQIRRTALALFRVHGYEGTSLQDLADRPGVTKAAVYYHYRSKDDLLLTLVEPLLDAVDAHLDRAGADDSPPRPFLSGLLDVLLDHGDVVLLLGRDLGVMHHPLMRARLDEQTARARAQLLRGRADEASLVRVVATLGTVWRPVLTLDGVDLARHRDVILDAACAALGDC
jgi:AcrR family transcriptional regulator